MRLPGSLGRAFAAWRLKRSNRAVTGKPPSGCIARYAAGEGSFDPAHPLTENLRCPAFGPRRLSSGSYAREGNPRRLHLWRADPGHRRQHGRRLVVQREDRQAAVNKELVLRSKIRIEARQFHMSRLHPQQWGERSRSTSRTIGRC